MKKLASTPALGMEMISNGITTPSAFPLKTPENETEARIFFIFSAGHSSPPAGVARFLFDMG